MGACRWYKEIEHGNTDKCSGGYTLYTLGCSILLICQFMLMCSIIGYEEKHRRKVRNNDLVSVFSIGGNDQDLNRTKVKPMKITVGGTTQSVAAPTPATGGRTTGGGAGMWETRSNFNNNSTTITTNASFN